LFSTPVSFLWLHFDQSDCGSHPTDTEYSAFRTWKT
jgi:hypothetical protein